MTCRYVTLTESLTGTEHQLPLEFKYTPHVPKKRVFYQRTAKGVVSQKANPLYTVGNDSDYIDWSITLTTKQVAKEFYQYYKLEDTFLFNGYYFDSYLVSFDDPIVMEPVAGYMKISGKFRVLCIYAEYQGCEEDPTTTTTTT